MTKQRNELEIDLALRALGITEVTKLGRGNRRVQLSALSESVALDVAYGRSYVIKPGVELHRIDEPSWYGDGTMCVTVRISRIA